MRSLSRALVAFFLVASFFGAFGVAQAEAVSVRDIVALTRAGLSDEVLIALIEADRTVFTLSPEQLIQLKKDGVSERVLLAMLRSARTEQPAAPPHPASPPSLPPDREVSPQVIIVGAREPCPPPPAPTVITVPVGVPFFPQVTHHLHHQLTGSSLLVRRVGVIGHVSGFGVIDETTIVAPLEATPVYWGWGGKLRPDAWGNPR